MKFDDVMAKIPQELHGDIMALDEYFKALRPVRFRRAVDKNGEKITYVASDYGVSHMLRISGGRLSQNLQWYIVYNGKPETWHRRADYMEETLSAIAKSDYPLAARIFEALKTCAGESNCYGERCLARTPYSFDDRRKLTCHGSAYLGDTTDDFSGVMRFFNHFNELVKEKLAAGEPPMEKIIVCKTKRSL